MKVIFVAGPYTARNAWLVEQNIRDAEEAALAIAEAGFAALCPHTMNRFFDGTCSTDHWYEATLELMRRCDAVYLLPGWESSPGACVEHAEAMRRNMVVSTCLGTIYKALAEQA